MSFKKYISNFIYLDQVLTRIITDRKIRKFIDHSLNSQQLVLNIGSGNTDYHTINIDVIKFENVHHIAKNDELPFSDNYADKALSIAVLEHSSEYEGAIKEMHRVLKPNGKIFVYLPFLFPYHVYPGQTADYYRFTKSGIMNRFGRYFKIKEVKVSGGPLLASVQAFAVFFAVLFSFGIKRLYILSFAFFTLLFLPLRLLDLLIWELPFSDIAATGFYFEGEKLAEPKSQFHSYNIEDPFTTVSKKFEKNEDY